jgi:hypothetical protein
MGAGMTTTRPISTNIVESHDPIPRNRNML